MDVNFSNPGEHVPDIERANRTLEEHFRVQFYRLPFEALPSLEGGQETSIKEMTPREVIGPINAPLGPHATPQPSDVLRRTGAPILVAPSLVRTIFCESHLRSIHDRLS